MIILIYICGPYKFYLYAIHVLTNYEFRGALSSKATLKWTEANLNKWLKSPADFAPGKKRN